MHTDQPEKNEAGASYIVRLLYRRHKDEQIVGVVESVEDGARHAFVSRDELWTILMRAGGDTKPDRMLDK